MFGKFKRLFGELPDLFWIVAGIRFIDRLGGTILVPFFSLYITDKFNVGMTEAGIVFGVICFVWNAGTDDGWCVD